MSRGLSVNVANEIIKSEVSPIILFEGEFASGWMRLWSGFGDLSWNGYTWTGAGTLMTVSQIEEVQDISAKGANLTLNGIPSGMLSLALNDVKQGKVGKVYLGFLSGTSVISDPYLLFSGRLDVPSIDEGAETSTINLSYESRLIDLQRVRVSRYTNEDQQRAFPGDLGCEFVTALQEVQINWGRSDSSGVSKISKG